jgi:peptidoglycan/xylan/chitin deacetylase (PgdA/CDA1 family)
LPAYLPRATRRSKIPLWLTEGQKKADSLASRGACAIALLGVWNFKGKNDFGGVTFLADFDHVAWNGRDVRIVFDNDMMRKPSVRKALERLTEHLQRKGATVSAVYRGNCWSMPRMLPGQLFSQDF